MIASGSLDNTVIVWDAESGQMTARWDFGKSIASLAFHPGSGRRCAWRLDISCTRGSIKSIDCEATRREWRLTCAMR